MIESKICIICKKEYFRPIRVTYEQFRNSKYCSNGCRLEFLKKFNSSEKEEMNKC